MRAASRLISTPGGDTGLIEMEPRPPGAVRPILHARSSWPLTCSLNVNMLEAMTGNLEKYLDLLSARQKLAASNIANADTPGYQTKDIDFQQEFMSMVNGQQPLTIEAEGLPNKPDGNNVNVDREARMLAENAMRFNVASVLLRGQINSVKSAITGGSTS